MTYCERIGSEGIEYETEHMTDEERIETNNCFQNVLLSGRYVRNERNGAAFNKRVRSDSRQYLSNPSNRRIIVNDTEYLLSYMLGDAMCELPSVERGPLRASVGNGFVRAALYGGHGRQRTVGRLCVLGRGAVTGADCRLQHLSRTGEMQGAAEQHPLCKSGEGGVGGEMLHGTTH